ncbi:MAG: VWA domain-containing protein [Planctomycetota bacterium]|nr:VWA domain-containing protein [Planctomycetota bacterium]
MLNPLLLWFLPLALVPVLLHLITLYRLRTVELSTFRFLMDSYIQQRRRVKLLEFLLMLLRTAFVALIILTLSRPVVEKFNLLTGKTGRDVTMIVDAGASMGLRTGGTTSLERAQAAARTVAGLLDTEDHITLIRAEDKPERLVAGFASQQKPVIEALNKIRPGVSTGNIAAALEEAVNGPARGPRIIYVLTDANRRGWSGLAGNPLTKGLGKETQVVVINTGPTEPVVNLAVVGDPPKSAHAIAGLPVLVSATVVNSSATKSADTVLSVFLDDQQVGQINLSLQPGQKVTRTIPLAPSRPGLVKGRFQLPADAFPDDDSFLFTLNVEPKLNVVIATPPPPPAPGSPSDLFIRRALTAPLETRSTVGAVASLKPIAAALEINTVPFASLTDPMLAAADVLILSDVPIDAGLGPRLRRFVNEGGGLLIFPGPSVLPEAYGQFLFAEPRTPPDPKAGVNALGFLAATGNPDDEAGFQPITSIDLNHPVLSAFWKTGESTYFSGTRLYRYFPIRLPSAPAPPTEVKSATPPPAAAPTPAVPGAAVPGAARPKRKPSPVTVAPLADASRPTVLMRLSDRTPVLVETRIGEGSVMLAGFAATPDWSNVPLRGAEFVPMLLRSVAHLRRESAAMTPSTVRPHEPAPIRVAGRFAQALVEVTDPAGKPNSVPLTRSGNQFMGALMQTDKKGYYDVLVSPRSPGGPERIDLGFAVNLDTQADFNSLTDAQIKGLMQPAAVTILRGSSDDPMLTQQLTQKREVWRTLIWVMFAVIGLEFFLSTLRPPAERRAGSGTGAGPGLANGSADKAGGKASSLERGAAAPAPPRSFVRRLGGKLVGAGEEK